MPYRVLIVDDQRMSRHLFESIVAANENYTVAASVETAIRFMYNWVPMVMCAIIFIIFVTSFNLDRDLKKLRAEKGIEA